MSSDGSRFLKNGNEKVFLFMNIFLFLAAVSFRFIAEDGMGGRRGSRKVIQQEVEFSHSSAHKKGGVRGHGKLSLVRSGLLWTGAFHIR